MIQNSLLIFVKNPIPGQTKTRLARSVGDQKALQIYQHLVDHTQAVSLPLKVNKEVWYSSEVEDDDAWSERHFKKRYRWGVTWGRGWQTLSKMLLKGVPIK